jgi:hypothetical protein
MYLNHIMQLSARGISNQHKFCDTSLKSEAEMRFDSCSSIWALIIDAASTMTCKPNYTPDDPSNIANEFTFRGTVLGNRASNAAMNSECVSYQNPGPLEITLVPISLKWVPLSIGHFFPYKAQLHQLYVGKCSNQ